MVAVKLLLQDDEITMDRIMREVHVLSRSSSYLLSLSENWLAVVAERLLSAQHGSSWHHAAWSGC